MFYLETGIMVRSVFFDLSVLSRMRSDLVESTENHCRVCRVYNRALVIYDDF
jgi:hypothetical protein